MDTIRRGQQRRADDHGRTAEGTRRAYLWRDPRSIGSISLAPGSCGSCRPAAAVKVERLTGRTTLAAAMTGTGQLVRSDERLPSGVAPAIAGAESAVRGPAVS